MQQQSGGGGASAQRAQAMYEIAMGVSQDRSDQARPYRDVRISIGAVANGAFEAALSFATGTPDLAFAVAKREIDLAAINPSPFLTMAYKGTGPFPEPLPLRAVAVMPSWDRMAFAVAERTGLGSLAAVREQRYPLRVSIRRNLSHATRFLTDVVLEAEGFSLRDLETWGGSLEYVDTPSEESRLAGIEIGALDAVFDEGIGGWGPLALHQGMRFLPLSDVARARLDGLGWSIVPITAARFPALKEEVLAASFSGWPIFTHATLPDQAAYQMARALDLTRDRIWPSESVALEDVCRDTDATGLGVPLHPGAERYYREQGAL